MKPLFTMREAVTDPALLGTMFDGPSWAVWKALLIASRGEPLTDEELALYTARTGRQEAPTEPVDETAFIAGRRSGKTVAASTLAMYLAALCDWSDVLKRGDRGALIFLAQSQRTAKVAFRHARAAFDDIPMLGKLVSNVTADTIELVNGVDLEIRPASFRSLRGMTAIGVVADEIAYWHSDDASANPDTEIMTAVRPAVATTSGPIMMISSPYRRRGELWEVYRRHYGPSGDPRILVAHGASRDFNETLPQKVVDRALERDPGRFSAEYLAKWRDDITGFLTREAVMGCVEAGIRERAPSHMHRYSGFIDAAGGSGMDSFTVAISHKEGSTAILDAVREVKPPFSPEAVTGEFAALLRRYRVSTAYGDKWGSEFVAEAFRKAGVYVEQSARPKSDLYLDLLPAINSGAVSLLDDDRLISQLASLERRTGPSGKDRVDHPPGSHDDLANSVAGALVLASKGLGSGAGHYDATRQAIADGVDYNPLDLSDTYRRAARRGIAYDITVGGNGNRQQAVAGDDYQPFEGV